MFSNTFWLAAVTNGRDVANSLVYNYPTNALSAIHELDAPEAPGPPLCSVIPSGLLLLQMVLMLQTLLCSTI